VAPGQKKAQQEQRTIVFVDESGFYLLPSVVRTFAPRGQTPVLRERLTRDHLSAISGVTPGGKLYMQVQATPFRSPQVVEFLQHLHRHIRGKVLVLWDGAPIHRSNVIKQYLAAGAAKWLQLERLPAYAPELNPDEGVWHLLKGVELRNLPCHDLQELGRELRKAKERLRHKTEALRACYRHTGLSDV
jgi:transposase